MTEPLYYLYCCQPTYIQGFLQCIKAEASPEIKTKSANIRGSLEGKRCWGRALYFKFPKVFSCMKSFPVQFIHWRLKTEQEISKLCSGEPRFTSCFHFFLHTICLMRCSSCLRVLRCEGHSDSVPLPLCQEPQYLFTLPVQPTALPCSCQPATSVTPGEAAVARRLALPFSHLTQTPLLPAPPYVLLSTVIHRGQRWEMPSGIVLAECSTPSGNRTRCDSVGI